MFFFSSRRRHTRYWRDWSSDVCSSDLPWPFPVQHPTLLATASYRAEEDHEEDGCTGCLGVPYNRGSTSASSSTCGPIAARSEERRVGKECRSRWSPYH